MLYDDEIIGMVLLAAKLYSAENKNLTGKNVVENMGLESEEQVQG